MCKLGEKIAGDLRTAGCGLSDYSVASDAEFLLEGSLHPVLPGLASQYLRLPTREIGWIRRKPHCPHEMITDQIAGFRNWAHSVAKLG